VTEQGLAGRFDQQPQGVGSHQRCGSIAYGWSTITACFAKFRFGLVPSGLAQKNKRRATPPRPG